MRREAMLESNQQMIRRCNKSKCRPRATPINKVGYQHPVRLKSPVAK